MKRFSGFICGVLVTLLVAGLASPALAALTAKTIEVYTGVTLYVDDVKFTPKNALGEEVEILLYNGTTYLPVRAIGEAYGKDIAWDDATKSAYIGYHEAPETQPALADGTYDVYFEKNSAKNGKVSFYATNYAYISWSDAVSMMQGDTLSFYGYDEYPSGERVQKVEFESSEDFNVTLYNGDVLWFWLDPSDNNFYLQDPAGAGVGCKGNELYTMPVAAGAKLVDWSTASERTFSSMEELLANTHSYNMLAEISVQNGAITRANIFFHP